jgi:hypothetical protein
MTAISKYGAFFSAVGCLMFSTHPAAAASVSNLVSREIRSEKGAVWVEDSLSIQEGYALRDPRALNVFVATQNKTNLSDSVRVMMQGEDLEVQKCDSKIRGDKMDLRVLSRVTFKETHKPARLRWVPYLAGQRITFHNGAIGVTNAGLEILIFENAGAPVLWFPDLGWVNSNDITTMEVYRKGIGLVFDESDIEFNLHLKTGKQSQLLFSWHPGAKVPDAPDPASLFRISQFNQMAEENRHRISQNDMYTLTTDLKIAKPGYYGFDGSINDGGR